MGTDSSRAKGLKLLYRHLLHSAVNGHEGIQARILNGVLRVSFLKVLTLSFNAQFKLMTSFKN